jgi:hypothetical protein
MMLKMWLLPNEDFDLHQYHLIITFGPPISQEFRCRRMQGHFEQILHWKVGLSTVQIVV